MAKKFFYVCAGVFLLALSYHFGAKGASAQISGDQVVGIVAGTFPGADMTVVTYSGDVYSSVNGVWQFHGNVHSSAPTPARQETFGSAKSRWR